MTRPISMEGQSGNIIRRLFGAPDEFLERYKNFTTLYNQSLDKELTNPALSPVKRRLINLQKNLPTMNLNLLSFQSKSILEQMMTGPEIANIEGMLNNFGTPASLFPSENIYRLSGKMLTDRTSGSHPYITWMDGQTISIDPMGKGVSAIGMGKTTIPTYETLKATFENERGGALLGKIIEDIRSGGPKSVFTFDVESGGLGVFSPVRSLGGMSMDLGADTLGNLTMSNIESTLAYQFATKDTRGLTYVDAVATGRSPKDLAELIFQRESEALDKFHDIITRSGGVNATDAQELLDLSTKEGRQKAAKSYKNFFEKALERDYIAGQNVQFDMQRIMLSAGLLDEFYTDKESMTLLQQFGQMAKDGRVINTVDLIRSSQMQQASDLAKRMGASDPEKTAMAIIRQTYSNRALGKMGLGSVAPASIQNLLLSSNFLDLVEGSGQQGQDLVKLISEGTTHQAQIDDLITMYTLRFVGGENSPLIWGNGPSSTTAQKAAVAALKSGSYSNITPIESVADLSAAAVKYMNTDQGMKSVKLFDDTRNEVISFNKAKGEWQARKMELSGEVNPRSLDSISTLQRVRDSVRRSAMGQASEIMDFGFTHIQQSRAEEILQNVNQFQSVSRSAPLAGSYDPMEAVIEALNSTREELGHNAYYGPMPAEIERFSRNPMAGIEATEKISYVQRLAKGNIGNAILDAATRRRAVEIANITSAIPYQQGQDLSGGARRQIMTRLQNQLSVGEITQQKFDEFLAMSGKELAESSDYAQEVARYNSRAAQVSKATSDFGGGFMFKQESFNIRTKQGGISVAQIPTDVLRNVDIQTSPGTTVKFLSDQFLQDYSKNRFSLSVARYSGENNEAMIRTNLIYGDLSREGEVIESHIARQVSDQVTQQLTDMFDSHVDDLSELVKMGHFTSLEQAQSIRYELSDKQKFADDLYNSLTERGVVYGHAGERSNRNRIC